MKYFYTIALLTLLSFKSHSQSCGPFDTSFGNAGRVYISPAKGTDGYINGGKLLVQDDRKIIMVIRDFDSTYSNFTVMRFTENGKTDSSFGVNGKAETKVGEGVTHANTGLLQRDGKILVAGACQTQKKGSFKLGLVRYNPNGSLDSSFGVNGKVITMFSDTDTHSINYYNDNTFDLALQSDDKILVSGTSESIEYRSSFALFRYTANGSPDGSFGTNGKVVLHIGSTDPSNNNYIYGGEQAKTVTVQDDGKIILAGQSFILYNPPQCDYCERGYYAFAMARFGSDGKPDSAFGLNGVVRDSAISAAPVTVLLQPDHKILVADASGAVQRYNIDGGPDNSFGTIRNYSIYPFGEAREMALLPDGKIIVEGRTYSLPDGDEFVLLQYNSDGTLDDGFYHAGVLHFKIGQTGFSDQPTSLAIQNGMILVAGSSWINSFENLVILRLGDSLADIKVTISPPGPINFCRNDSILLTASQAGKLQWYMNGGIIPNATGNSYKASAGGSYTVNVINASGCGISDPLIIRMNTGPAKPVIYWNGMTLNTGTGVAGYQWLLDGIAIPGANSNEFRPQQNGSYTVSVYDNNDCGNTSDAYNLVALAVTNIPMGNITLRYYPNPATDILFLDMSGIPTGKQQAQLFDLNGNLLRRQLLNRTHNEIPVSNLPSGPYLLVIYDNTNRMAVKIMVMR